MEDDDAALAEQMTGYPAEQDAFSSGKSGRAEKVWFSGITKETLWHCKIVLPDPGSRLSWRSNWTGRNGIRRIFDGKWGVFDAYFRKNQIPDPPLFHPDRLYIGNAFCPHLAPTEEELFALMDKACRESFSITLTFPFFAGRKSVGNTAAAAAPR